MDSQPLAAVVLAAGLGKRMASRQPKVLHRLAGLPLAAHVLRALAPLNPSRTIMVVGHGADQVRAALGDTYGPDDVLAATADEPGEPKSKIQNPKSKIEYVLQPEQLGTGHAVLMAEPLLRDYEGPVLVLYGDSPLLRPATLSALLNRHRQARANLTMLTCIAADPTGYGRILRDQEQRLVGVVEERAATLVQRAISEINSGVYIFDSAWLWPRLEKIKLNAQGEYYLTDLIGIAIAEERAGNTDSRLPAPDSRAQNPRSKIVTLTLEGLDEAMGINSREHLAQAERTLQQRLRQQWMRQGVTMLMPDSVYLGMDVQIGMDAVLYPGVILEGRTKVGAGCVLGPNTHIIDSTVGEECRIIASMVEGSTLERGVTMGPYSHLRPGTHLGEEVHMGNFGEVVRSTLERGVAMGHFSYVGDAHVGEETNIGAGTVTVNYDGQKKNRTRIGKRAFIGSDTMLRAPVEVGEGAVTGTGSVVTKDVPPHTVVVGVPARIVRQVDRDRGEE